MGTAFLLFATAHAQENPKVTYLSVYVYDAEENIPVSYATVAIPDLNKFQYTDTEGMLVYRSVPNGTYQLQITRIGYKNSVKAIRLTGDSLFVEIPLQPRPIASETIVIEENRKREYGHEVGDADFNISGEKLRQNLGTTIAATVDGEPGMAQRSMGPAPARPVLRGLGGDRLMILEDGGRTGDLSATSNDHAVVLDPIGAQNIQVYRGPEALQFGSNTLAGVINVENNNIPASVPNSVQMMFSGQAESVNRGLATGLHSVIPVGESVAFDVSGSYRAAQNMYTPDGELDNTGLTTSKVSAGASYIKDWGFIGATGGFYLSDYGIPGGFIGAHPNGVDIELQRYQTEIRTQYYAPVDWIHHINLDYKLVRYFHQEYESNGSLGMEFGVITNSLKLNTHFEGKAWGTTSVGLWAQNRNYATGGLTFTPNAIEQEWALFAYNEKELENWIIKAAARVDFKSISPDENRFLENVGQVRDRSFKDVTASLGITYDINKNWDIGTRMIRTFKAPGIEELFSKGPHLAAYSFEIGNADLDQENGLGFDLLTSYHTNNFHAEITGYWNSITNYIFPENTNERAITRNDLYLYQFVGQDAEFKGVEGHIELSLTDSWSTNGTFSYVHATLTSKDEPVPFIPPVSLKWELKYSQRDYSAFLNTHIAGEQDRTGEFEEPTDGYAILGAGIEYRKELGGGLHIFTLQAENLLNTTYRNHLSRVKSIMPEPGFNLQFLVKSYF
jgi:iron complex outermembrane receptor protein